MNMLILLSYITVMLSQLNVTAYCVPPVWRQHDVLVALIQLAWLYRTKVNLGLWWRSTWTIWPPSQPLVPPERLSCVMTVCCPVCRVCAAARVRHMTAGAGACLHSHKVSFGSKRLIVYEHTHNCRSALPKKEAARLQLRIIVISLRLCLHTDRATSSCVRPNMCWLTCFPM